MTYTLHIHSQLYAHKVWGTILYSMWATKHYWNPLFFGKNASSHEGHHALGQFLESQLKITNEHFQIPPNT